MTSILAIMLAAEVAKYKSLKHQLNRISKKQLRVSDTEWIRLRRASLQSKYEIECLTADIARA